MAIFQLRTEHINDALLNSLEEYVITEVSIVAAKYQISGTNGYREILDIRCYSANVEQPARGCR